MHCRDAFVFQWSAVPAQITAGLSAELLLTFMFMHGGWLHIAGNISVQVSLWP
jgi:membrane associated rhomboid family serine protease